ncbi:MAG TPA: FAD/NAD(P)-binding oxidoreductase [Candidatus Thermoplasmatota archaeon]|nr:FAD/NAD(P)-binding oxidoreductase [Candidatus Thermoplasmatota archaeon]
MHALVLGAGFGGIAAALELRRLLPAGGRVTLVDEGATFRMGLGNLWLLDGRRRVGEGSRPLARLARHGIEVVRGRVEAIDPQARVATVAGRRVAADGLVVALGAQLAPEATPGFREAHNLYEEAGAAAIGEALHGVADGGRVLVQVCGLPFKCPPAPYEAALLAAAVLRRRGVAAEVHLATPEPHPLPVAPPEAGANLLPLLLRAGVRYHPGRRVRRFVAGGVEWEGGEADRFDLMAAVPVHKAPDVVAAAGLAGASGFVDVEAGSLRTRFPRLHAVGDVCAIPLPNGKMMPKAGVLAEGQGRAAARHLAADLLQGGAAAPFDGRGACFIELGGGEAVLAEGEFLAAPQPRFTFRPASPEGLRLKEAFETERLEGWFGPA